MESTALPKCRRNSRTQITDGQVETMFIETENFRGNELSGN